MRSRRRSIIDYFDTAPSSSIKKRKKYEMDINKTNDVMKKAVFILIGALCVGCGGGRQEGNFTLTVRTGEPRERERLYVRWVDDRDSVRVDTAEYREGAFVLRGRVSHFRRAAMLVNEGITSADYFAVFGTPVFLEEGDILVEAGRGLADARVGGTSANEELQELNDSLRFYTAWEPGYRERFGKYYRERDWESMGALRTERDSMERKRRVVEQAFVEGHPGSVVSLDWIARSFNLARQKSRVEELYGGLTEELRRSAAGRKFAARMEATPSVEAGQPAPEFAAEDKDGKRVALGDFRGRYVLLDFWASWCGPCRAENPNVLKAYERFKGEGFTVLGYSLDESREKWLGAVEADGMPWTQVIGGGGLNDSVVRTYGVTGIPSNFLIDPEGRIMAVDLRGERLEKTLSDIFK